MKKTIKHGFHLKFKSLRIFIILISIGLISVNYLNGYLIKDAVSQTTPDPAVVGQWSQVYEWPIKSTHATLMPNGKVLTWPSVSGDQPHIWDPITNTISPAAPAGYNIFCSGHTVLGDGKIFVAGGHVVTPVGVVTASIYDPETNSWKRIPDMNNPRWYPTTTVLSNGDILTIGGTIESGVKNNIAQVWDINQNSWRDLNNAEKEVPLYPQMFVAPNGKLFMSGSGSVTQFLNSSGNGAWETSYKPLVSSRSTGSSVMYAPGKILRIGGSNGKATLPNKTVEKINLTATTPAWSYTGSMTTGRRHANATLLPTGEVLVTGGTKGMDDDKTKPAFAAEVWNPDTGNWTVLAKNQVYRGYHSVGLLLPDGRVLVAGGEKSGTSAEIYSPPYLFKGGRPRITAAPTNVMYGDKFNIDTPSKDNITKVKWIRHGSVTHSFNQSQVINNLSFTKTTTGLQITVPNNRNNTPPGYYMLFILNKNNVPSIAKIIKVGDVNIDLSKIESPTSTPSGHVEFKNHPQLEHDHIDE